ncbi:putative bifunctional dTTP/UTP pyrophosphatase/methyltransferase protein isoform X3 [Echeneis naucrates]|uniref:putative bifunctional dTTP/UTP pyrophosphatase/methyltransferase protein isoform X3 n=1 Tax=Echeneis naucrates TaxID=173247 RepID=UPI001113AB34|nr:probable bifunctional dTTP/UTP pyrophosphatase/methyltransferase protein isoform X3 [Echeneis naucrates]
MAKFWRSQWTKMMPTGCCQDEEVDYQLIDFYEETKVKFADLSEDMLWEYINSGEPMDKAGGYGIQALGGMLVEYVHGDFLNVVGFPLNHFCKQLDLIYNQSTSSTDQECPSVHVSNSSSHATSTSTQPPPKMSTQFSHSTSSSTKRNSEPKPRPNSPSASQTHHTNDSPSFSPVHKVMKKNSNSEVGEGSWMLVNSLSKRIEIQSAELQDPEKATLPSTPSRGQAIELNVTEHEDGELKKEDLEQITELMDGFKASKALFTASELCIFDLLQSRPGLDAAQVAKEIKASVKGTERLLEACVSLGLLKSKDGMHHNPLYENADLAVRFLRSDAPFSLRGYIQHCNSTVWPLFSHLESAVREGTNQRERAFGKKSDDVFQDTYYNSQEVKLRFMKAMHSIAKVTGKAVATAFDLSNFKTACDLGGCTGALAYELTKAHPGLSVTVFDLPAVVEMSEHFYPQQKDNRVSFVAGDFFQDELPKADLYILARVLHDWPDEKVHILLTEIADAAAPGCAVLIAETMLDGQTPYSALQSLNMLVQTEGRERTASKYAEMLRKHRFGKTHVVHTKNFLDAVISIKIS